MMRPLSALKGATSLPVFFALALSSCVASVTPLTASSSQVTVENTLQVSRTPPPSITPRPTATGTPVSSFVPAGARARLGNGWIQNLTVSGDGRTLLVSGPAGFFLYDVETLQQKLAVPTDLAVLGSAISADGHNVATFTGDNVVSLWDGESSAQLWTYPAGVRQTGKLHSGYDFGGGNTLAFSPDGKILAVVLRSSFELVLLDSSRGEVIQQLIPPEDNAALFPLISSLAFSPDGKTLAASDSAKGILFWDIPAGTPLPSPVNNSIDMRALAYSPDGKTVAYNVGYGVGFLDLAGGTVRLSESEHDAYVNSVAYSPDGKMLVSAAQDGTVKLWNPATGKLIRTLAGAKDLVSGAGFTAGGGKIVSGSLDGSLAVWDARDGALLVSDREFQDYANCLAFSPDGTRLIVGYEDGTSVVWDAAEAKVRSSFSGQTDSVRGVALSPDGKTAASGSWDDSLILWNAESGQQKIKLQADRGNVLSVAFSPDGSLLVSGHEKNALMRWDGRTGANPQRLRFGPLSDSPFVRDLAFSSDGKRLMTFLESDSSAAVEVLDISTWKPVKIIENPSFAGQSIAFSLDGNQFIAASYNSIVRYDVDSGERIQTYPGYGQRLQPVALSPDGQTIAIAPNSNPDMGDIVLRDLISGDLIGSFSGHAALIWALTFSPDGKTLASASLDGTVILWDVP